MDNNALNSIAKKTLLNYVDIELRGMIVLNRDGTRSTIYPDYTTEKKEVMRIMESK